MSHSHKIILCDGNLLDIFDADSIRKNVTLESIAVGLSNKCRYGGQCKQFYSLASHSYFLAKHFERIGKPELIPIALMHDCAEAILPDIPAPIKKLIVIYISNDNKEIQYRYFIVHEYIIKSIIFAKFGLDSTLLPQIHEADIAIRETEMHYLFGTPAPAELMISSNEWFAQTYDIPDWRVFLKRLEKYITPTQA